MIRRLTAYLMIAVVLSCPYQCLGEAVRDVGAPAQEKACCCRDRGHAPGDQTPQSPQERDEDCLCHGAIFDGSRMADDKLNSLVASPRALEITSSAISLSLAAFSFELPHPFPPFSTGRDVCALTCTLKL